MYYTFSASHYVQAIQRLLFEGIILYNNYILLVLKNAEFYIIAK